MAVSGKNTHILLSKRCGAARTEILRALSAMGLSADVQTADCTDPVSFSPRPDAVIVSAEEFEWAVSAAERPDLALLMIAGADEIDRLRPACVSAGILVECGENLCSALTQLLAECARLRAARMQTRSLKRQLDDTRLVTRAKLLLMSHLQMSEEQAHRYIEKTAMDGCQSKREIAERIIRTYEV